MITEGISHTPFIIGSYAIATFLLAWCALSPVWRRKAVLRQIRKRIKSEEQTRDTNS